MPSVVKGLAGDPLAWACLTLALGGLLWHHEHHFQRLTAWLFAASAAFLVLAIPAWRGALAGLTLTGAGLTILGIAALIIFPAFHLQAIRAGRAGRLSKLLAKKGGKGTPGGQVALLASGPARRNHHRRIGTPIVAMCAGTLAIVVIGAWRLLADAAGRSAAGAGQALLRSSAQISSGRAAATVPAGSRPGILIAGVAALIVVAMIMRSHDKRKRRSGSGRSARGSGTPALGSGGRS